MPSRLQLLHPAHFSISSPAFLVMWVPWLAVKECHPEHHPSHPSCLPILALSCRVFIISGLEETFKLRLSLLNANLVEKGLGWYQISLVHHIYPIGCLADVPCVICLRSKFREPFWLPLTIEFETAARGVGCHASFSDPTPIQRRSEG